MMNAKKKVTMEDLMAKLESMDSRISKLEEAAKAGKATKAATPAKKAPAKKAKATKAVSKQVKSNGGKVYKADRELVYSKMPKKALGDNFDYAVYRATAIKLGVWHEC